MAFMVDDGHRKELLRFLLVKTAGVRLGVKPGELLRVQNCYKGINKDGLHFCMYHRDVFEVLQLEYIVLSVDSQSSLVLFYHEQEMNKVLNDKENLDILIKCGYKKKDSVTGYLKHLQLRFGEEKIPHEVGVFIGYPAKDVVGFINNQPRTPVHKGYWTVFGEAESSIAKMNLYGDAEKMAKGVLDSSENIQSFLENISRVPLSLNL